MAKGRPCVTCYVVFALLVVAALAVTGVWNPFPGVYEWASRGRPLSTPDVVWQQRVGGSPQSVTITGDTLVIEQRTTVEARSLATGIQIWERKADWAAVAGSGRDSVVAVGKLLTKGYEVIDPATGAVRRRDSAAIGVWTYRNALLDVRCADARDCTLTAWEPRGSTPLWTVFLPGVRAGFIADNPDLLGTRRFTTDRVHDDAGGPELMPSLLGFPVDGRVHVVDTATGRAVRDTASDRDVRVSVVGGRLLRIEARAEDGTCNYTISGHDPVDDTRVWRHAGVNMRTADGAGCVQRHDPQGGRNVVVGTAPDGREAVIDAYHGRLLWVGAEGEKLLAVDDRHLLARSADGAAVHGRVLGKRAAGWSRPLGAKGGAALTPYAALLLDRSPGRILALDPATGRELADLRTDARVLAVGAEGMVLGDGRDLGYLRFGASAGDPDGEGSTVPDPGVRPGAPQACGGPKQQPCPPGEAPKDG
jgi:hypothetical protein